MSGQAPRLNESTSVVVARPVAYGRPTPSPPDLEMSYLRRRDALLDLSLVLLVAIVLRYVPGLLAPIELGGIDMPEVGALVMLEKWRDAAVVVALLLYFVLRHRIRPASFGLRRDGLGLQTLWGLATLGSVCVALLATSAVVLTLFFLFPALKGDLLKRVEFIDAMPVDNLAGTLVLLVAVAVHEEVLFRGMLLPYLRRVLGSWWWAGLVSALIFAALHVPHQGLLGGIQILSIAAVLTVFFILSRSLLAVSLAHLVFNFIQFQIFRSPGFQKLLEGFET